MGPATSSPARDRLLRSAAATFYAEGIRGVGVDRLVSEAGVTRATFYRHFPAKEDLVVAYLDAVDGEVHRQVGAVPHDRAGAAAFVRHVAEVVAGMICAGDFRGCAFINAAAEYADPDHPVHRAVLRHRSWLTATITGGFAAAGHPEPVEAGRRFVMLRDGAVVWGQLTDPPQARRSLLASVDELLATVA